jgi:hypothetical protein
MDSVYESLRNLLRSKELEIKRLEKEIEALRTVLPIVAEAGEAKIESLAVPDAPRAGELQKPRNGVPGPDLDALAAQLKASQTTSVPSSQNRPTAVPDAVPSKTRTSWP